MSARASDSIVHRVTGVCLLSELYALCNSCNSFRLVLSFHRTRPAGPPSGGGAAEHACASTRPGADDHQRTTQDQARTLLPPRDSSLDPAFGAFAARPRAPSAVAPVQLYTTLHSARSTRCLRPHCRA